MIQLNPSIGSIANNDAVLESAITISANHTVVTVHRAALVNKRCLVLEVHQMHPVSHGGDALDPSKVPIVTGPLAVEFSNISWSVFEASTDSMNGALSRYGRVELCTTSFNANGKQHFQMLGVLSGSVQASLRIPLLCRQVLPSYSSMLDIVFVASDSSSSDTTPIQRAVTAPLSLNANSIARRGLPTLQRVGGGGCTADAADGLWELDMGKEQWALYGGSVLGNITIVIVLWAGFGLLAMIWWSCWNGKEFTTTDTPSQSPITIVALLIWTAFRSVHMASLWLPIFAVVIVPVTTNAVALTFMWINDTNTASWRLTGVFALLVGVWTLLVLLWVGQNAKRCLVVDRTIRRKLATNVQASWWELLTRRFKWRAPEDNKRSISFKLHAQLALDEATSWWYIPFDTLLAVAVAVTDGSGKALGGGNRAACWVSLCIGPLTQLLLLLVVLRWTPHGDLFTHWIAVLASLLCFAAGVMQLLLAMIQVDLFDVPSDVEKTMLVVLSALLLVAAGVSWMRYVANLVSVLVWIFGNMTGRSKYGAARNGAVVATSRTRTASAVVISRRTSSVALMISTPYEKETTFAAPRSAERTPLRKVPSMSFFVPPTTPTTSVPVLNDSGDEDDSFVHLPFSSPFEITVIRPPPQENVKDSDGNTNDDMVVAFPPFVINEKASSFSSSEDGSISVRRKRSDGKRNPLTSAYGHEEARNNKKETWMLL